MGRSLDGRALLWRTNIWWGIEERDRENMVHILKREVDLMR